ncbi:helix-turn-helix domain-containing protein [Motiliproteus sediminis]|uniref:helix-turn-helix domain-containing protein n=1 Tax=Motiliproteus sediminis TaxID=1468178 RepID=UPI001AEF68D8|nr:winged helix-turn-helix domain-containing protein [Motiliproteus sediminis]
MTPDLNPTFCRRLLVAHLIDTLERPSVPTLMTVTGWPRRTLQDIIKALPGWGIEVTFVEDGVRHNDGYYRLSSWGAFRQEWISAQLDRLCKVVELRLP